MEIICLESADSTNSWLAQHEDELPSTSLVYCKTQTAGRGQRGNSWESEPGKNITASIIFHPEKFPAIKQFMISEIIALTIVDFLNELGVKASVKWPNDIYVGNGKICGILVEHVVTGCLISRTIAGFGININQTIFQSDAPNPVSLSMLTGLEYDIEKLIHNLTLKLEKNLQGLDEEQLHERFLELLWRKDGYYHKFFDRKNNEPIEALIDTVERTGILNLKTRQGEKREYSFKEVEFIIDE